MDTRVRVSEQLSGCRWFDVRHSVPVEGFVVRKQPALQIDSRPGLLPLFGRQRSGVWTAVVEGHEGSPARVPLARRGRLSKLRFTGSYQIMNQYWCGWESRGPDHVLLMEKLEPGRRFIQRLRSSFSCMCPPYGPL